MTETATTRRPRADALRNRQRIVHAAIDAFREQGLDVSVAEIARRAGVGSGTLFRNFHSKEDLIEAIVELQIERLNDAVAALAETENPGAAFASFFAEAVRFHYEDRGMLEAVMCGVLDKPQMEACRQRAASLTDTILANAKAVGAVRSDVTADDLHALASGAAQAVLVAAHEAPSDAERARERYVSILLDGLRP